MSDEPLPTTSPPPADEALLYRADDGRGGFRAYDPFRVGRILARELQGEKVGDLIGKMIGERRTLPDGTSAYLVTDEAASFDAGERLFAAARAAFELPPVRPDGSGFTEAAVERVLRGFVKFKAAVKKNFGSSPT